MTCAYTAPGLAKEAGVTYREFDYWIREGYINTTPVNNGEDRATPGTGKSRVFVGRDAEIAMTFARLVRIGFKPSMIENAAVRLVDRGEAHLPLGVTLIRTPVSS